jgi:hypothetical protein
MGTEKTVSALGNFPRATANGSCFPSRLSECTEQKEGGRATCGVWEKETGRCWNVAAAKPNCRRRKEARSIRFDSILRLPDWTQRHIVARPLGIDLSSHIKQHTHTHTHTHTHAQGFGVQHFICRQPQSDKKCVEHYVCVIFISSSHPIQLAIGTPV